MKKGLRKVISVVLMSVMLSSNVYASEDMMIWEKLAEEQLKNTTSELSEGSNTAVNRSIQRGRYIASSGLSITNKGYGVLEVYADTLAYQAVKKIKMTIFLDQWSENDEDWIQIDSKSMTYEYDGGSEDLHEVSETFLVENLETGKYYRLRGLHAVWSFDGYIESHTTMTDGILLTDGPA